jgi:hypothetical protein
VLFHVDISQIIDSSKNVWMLASLRLFKDVLRPLEELLSSMHPTNPMFVLKNSAVFW